MITEHIKTRIEKCISDCVNKILSNHELKIPFFFRTDMKGIAGLAYCYENKRIELSQQLFLENMEDFFLKTIPHEVAHILTVILYPYAKQDHGPEWKSIMRELGVQPKRCHDYDITTCFKANDRIKYACACNHTHMLTKIRHKRIKNGVEYRCGKCSSRLIEFVTKDIY